MLLTSRCSFLDVEWTLYEQMAIAAMDCQCLDVAKVLLSFLLDFGPSILYNLGPPLLHLDVLAKFHTQVTSLGDISHR